jgi:RimJ/RimL family protein N-acetyltransferase
MTSSEPVIMLRGERVALGPLAREHVETFQRWLNDIRVTRTLAIGPKPMTLEAEEAWYGAAAHRGGSDIQFAIYALDGLALVGTLGLHGIDYQRGTADFGILIGDPANWNKGYGSDATRLMLQYGFDVLGLHNVMLEVYSYNPAGIKAYERAGFRTIGVRRGAVTYGRKRGDIILMDAVADDFEPSNLHELIVDGPPRG